MLNILHQKIRNASFVSNQKKNTITENFNPDKCNIAFFVSSQDEREAFNIWKSDIYKNQNEAIRKIAEDLNLIDETIKRPVDIKIPNKLGR